MISSAVMSEYYICSCVILAKKVDIKSSQLMHSFFLTRFDDQDVIDALHQAVCFAESFDDFLIMQDIFKV